MPPRPNTAAALSLLAVLAAFPAGAQPPDRGPIVRVEGGAVAGAQAGDVNVFKAIPYAAAPVGPLRWRPPRPPLPWRGVRSAAAFGPACLQPTGAAAITGDPGPVSEDCLTLNVWAPKGARGLPVMVWIHGGGHRFGSSSQPIYDGASFARDGVLLVSFNYRLAGLGFFAHPALTREAGPEAPLGDYGVMDQIAALKWIRRNIQAFGGDPRRLTVFGESSSALDVQALMTARTASGLFQRAIVESSCAWDAPVTLAEREADGVRLAGLAGLQGADATPAALRALPADAFLDPGFSFEFAPFPDGRLLTRTSAQAFAEGRAAAIPLIVGSNSDEGVIARSFEGLGELPRQLAALYPNGAKGDTALRQLYTDRYFGAPCRWIARQQARRTPTYLYRFSYVPTALRGALPGAPHGGELAFVFDSWDAMGPASAPSPEDRATTRRLHGCWVAFARTGRPDCPGTPPWPAYSPKADALMDFDVTTQVRSQVRKPQDDALDRLVLPTLLRADPRSPPETAKRP